MQVRPMRGNDVRSFDRWISKRGLNLKTEQVGAGFIVPGVACAYLIHTSAPGTAILDSIITNPYCSSKARSAALEALFAYVTNFAKSAGYHRLLGYTLDDGIQSRALRHGFQAVPHKLLIKEL